MKKIFNKIKETFELLSRARCAGVLARCGDKEGAIKLMNGVKII